MIEVFRLYEKSDESFDLIGSDYYVIKSGENDFKGYKREDISTKINNCEYDGINWIFNGVCDLEIEHIQNVNYGFKYKNTGHAYSLKKMYFTNKINLIDRPIMNHDDEERVVNIIHKIIENKESDKYDNRLYYELLGEYQYVKNENLKYLFLVGKISA